MIRHLVCALSLGLILGAAMTLNASGPGVVSSGLIVDLNADKGVAIEDGKVASWKNQVKWKAMDFEGKRIDGRPSLKKSWSLPFTIRPYA